MDLSYVQNGCQRGRKIFKEVVLRKFSGNNSSAPADNYTATIMVLMLVLSMTVKEFLFQMNCFKKLNADYVL